MKIILLGLLFLLCFDLQAGIRKSKLKVLYVGSPAIAANGSMANSRQYIFFIFFLF